VITSSSSLSRAFVLSEDSTTCSKAIVFLSRGLDDGVPRFAAEPRLLQNYAPHARGDLPCSCWRCTRARLSGELSGRRSTEIAIAYLRDQHRSTPAKSEFGEESRCHAMIWIAWRFSVRSSLHWPSRHSSDRRHPHHGIVQHDDLVSIHGRTVHAIKFGTPRRGDLVAVNSQ